MRGAWFQRCQALGSISWIQPTSLASSASCHSQELWHQFLVPSNEEHLPSASSIAPDHHHHPTLFHQRRPAQNCISITGSLPPPLSFDGIPCLYTSSLTSSANAHQVPFILGGPGAGKGTQSGRIFNTYKCVHPTVGDLRRTGAVKEDLANVPVDCCELRLTMDEKAEESDNRYIGIKSKHPNSIIGIQTSELITSTQPHLTNLPLPGTKLERQPLPHCA